MPYALHINGSASAARFASAINPSSSVFKCRLPISLPKPYLQEISMSEKIDKAQAETQAYQPIPFAKKHRISVEDATAIIKKHGTDRKSADKEARRVAV
jgi:hypothetical protein